MRSRRAYLASCAAAGALLSGCLDRLREDDGGSVYDPEDVRRRNDVYDNTTYEERDEPGGREDGTTDQDREDSTGDQSDDGQRDTDTSEPDPSPDHLIGLSGSTSPGPSRGSTTESFSWEYGGSEYTLQIPIPNHLLEYYEGRSRVNDRGVYVSDPFDLDTVESIANEIDGLAENDHEAVELARSFVQQLPYTNDEVSAGINQYTMYPLETLSNRGGDCEDTAILLSAILTFLGYGTVLLAYFDQGHMALGLQGDESVDGTYYEARGSRYYYVETTAPGWEVGKVPDSLDASTTEFQWIDDVGVLMLDWETRSAGDGEVDLRCWVTNVGPAREQGVDALVQTEARGEEITAQQRTDAQSIGSQEQHLYTTTLSPPAEREQRVRVQVGVGDRLHDETVSDWQSP